MMINRNIRYLDVETELLTRHIGKTERGLKEGVNVNLKRHLIVCRLHKTIIRQLDTVSPYNHWSGQ